MNSDQWSRWSAKKPQNIPKQNQLSLQIRSKVALCSIVGHKSDTHKASVLESIELTLNNRHKQLRLVAWTQRTICKSVTCEVLSTKNVAKLFATPKSQLQL